MEQAPLIFGKYDVVRRIAVGGMGEIFLARQVGVPGFERLVILKRLLGEMASQPDLVEQFLDEARVAATLSHANIVSIYEVGLWQGNYFIAMEYVRGYTLVHLIRGAVKRGVPLAPAIVARIIHDASLGLEHAHQARDTSGHPLRIVHRDVSPQNIMVREDGVIKVLDFGIARAANRSARTSTGALKGKIGYMPPEQMQGREVDGRSDQYALGVVLWELCARRRLHGDDNPIRVIRSVLDEPIPSPAAKHPGLPPALEQIVMRMLAREPSERFSSCADVARALRRVVDELDPQLDERTVATYVAEIAGPITEEVSEATPISQRDFLIDLRSPTPGRLEVVLPFDAKEDTAPEGHPVPGPEGTAPRRRHPAQWVVALLLLAVAAAGAAGAWWQWGDRLLARGRERPTPSPVAARAVSSPTPPSPALPASALPAATLVIETKPAGATVLVGTRVLGVTPLRTEALGAGVDHLLTVEKRGYEAVDVAVRVEAGQVKSLSLALARGKGGKRRAETKAIEPEAKTGSGDLTLTTKPWTNVWIDGVPFGPSPLFKTRLAAGRHTVRLLNEQAGVDTTRTVTIKDGESVKLTWELSP
jgi:serine/threonine-protein kinase